MRSVAEPEWKEWYIIKQGSGWRALARQKNMRATARSTRRLRQKSLSGLVVAVRPFSFFFHQLALSIWSLNVLLSSVRILKAERASHGAPPSRCSETAVASELLSSASSQISVEMSMEKSSWTRPLRPRTGRRSGTRRERRQSVPYTTLSPLCRCTNAVIHALTKDLVCLRNTGSF